MARAVFALVSRSARQDAATWAMNAPAGTAAEFIPPGRTADQNAKMWAMLTEVSRATTWHGEALANEDWRLLFLDALPRPLRMVPNLPTSSSLGTAEFATLLDLIAEFGAREGIIFLTPEKEPTRDREAAPQPASRHRRPPA